MARYLSPAWFDEVARHQAATSPAERFVLEQVVTGSPDGEVRYRVVVGDRAARLVRDGGPDPDVTFTTDYPTAAAVARGALSMQAALAAGRVRVRGDLGRLADLVAAGALNGVDPVPAAVREGTTWDEP